MGNLDLHLRSSWTAEHFHSTWWHEQELHFLISPLWAIWQQEEPILCTEDHQGDKPVDVAIQKPGWAESAHSRTEPEHKSFSATRRWWYSRRQGFSVLKVRLNWLEGVKIIPFLKKTSDQHMRDFMTYFAILCVGGWHCKGLVVLQRMPSITLNSLACTTPKGCDPKGS